MRNEGKNKGKETESIDRAERDRWKETERKDRRTKTLGRDSGRERGTDEK